MPEVESRDGANSVEAVLAEFDRRKDQLSDLSKATAHLIETILKEEQIAIHSVQTRVKSRDKLKSKYCRSEKDYRCLGDIPDLVGLRIITYYSDRIDRIAEILKREFAQLEVCDDKRIGRPESFGYSALHMDCAYLEKRLESTEYKRFANARFEIQIVTVLGHAWAEMHHAWYDSGDSPTEEERRFHRLAAVLELAEQEFLEIRKKKDARERIASVQVAAESPEIPITAESLKAFIEQKAIVTSTDAQLAAVLERAVERTASQNQLAQLVSMVIGAKIGTIQELEAKLMKAVQAVTEYVDRCKPFWELAQGRLSDFYTRGFCIFHLVNLLVAARGEEEFRSFNDSVGRTEDPLLDLGQQVGIAKDIAEKYCLLKDQPS